MPGNGRALFRPTGDNTVIYGIANLLYQRVGMEEVGSTYVYFFI